MVDILTDYKQALAYSMVSELVTKGGSSQQICAKWDQETRNNAFDYLIRKTVEGVNQLVKEEVE